MISQFNQVMDQVKDQEKKSKESVEMALKEKDEYINKERENNKKELRDYEAGEKQNLKKQVADLSSNKEEEEKMEKKISSEMKQLQKEYDVNKEGVINFILDSVLDVDLSIPDVVKGQYSKKLGISR